MGCRFAILFLPLKSDRFNVQWTENKQFCILMWVFKFTYLAPPRDAYTVVFCLCFRYTHKVFIILLFFLCFFLFLLHFNFVYRFHCSLLAFLSLERSLLLLFFVVTFQMRIVGASCTYQREFMGNMNFFFIFMRAYIYSIHCRHSSWLQRIVFFHF